MKCYIFLFQPYKQRDIKLEGEKGVRLKDKHEVITILGFYEHVDIFISFKRFTF